MIVWMSSNCWIASPRPLAKSMFQVFWCVVKSILYRVSSLFCCW